MLPLHYLIKTLILIFVMYLEAKETARLYELLTEKLGSDTTEAMFKYIDNKTERTVEANIKTLATKEDMEKLRIEMTKVRSSNKEDIAAFRSDMAGFKLAITEDFA